MIHRYELSLPIGAIATHFNCQAAVLPIRREVHPMQQAPVVRLAGGSKPELALLRWSLLPRWAPNSSWSGTRPLAPVDALTAPIFHDAFLKRHCLVPATAFIAAETEAGATAAFRYERGPRTPVAFAGIWERWRSSSGGAIESFALLTLQSTTGRADGGWPVVITPRDYALWLSTDAADVGRQAVLLQTSRERWSRSAVALDDEIGGAPAGHFAVRAAAPGFMRSTGRLNGLGWYHLNLLSATGSIVGRDDFQARDDASARLIAAMIHDACSDRAATFELWQAARKVPAAVGTALRQTVDQDTADLLQSIAIEREEILSRSRTSVARSKRLLERLSQLRPLAATITPAPTKAKPIANAKE